MAKQVYEKKNKQEKQTKDLRNKHFYNLQNQ